MEKNPILKKFRTCVSLIKNKHHNKTAKMAGSRVVPTGCLTVCVGPERRRFVIKTEYVNHPLFRMLLEDAESEYGFRNEGPLMLPCDVDLFCKVLAAMESSVEEDDDRGLDGGSGGGGGCSPFNPARRLSRSGGSYGRLVPPRMIRINDF